MKTYHVGLAIEGRTAVFQFRRCIDYLSCELYEYLGERLTTKAAARERLQPMRDKVLADLRAQYPNKDLRRIRID